MLNSTFALYNSRSMQKSILIDGLEHPVILSRRKGTRNIRLSIKSDGVVSVSVPYGVPEILARKFVENKAEWILKHHKPASLISDSAHIGKNHTLIILPSKTEKHSTRVTNTEIIIKLPDSLSSTSVMAQKIIKQACEKALLQESKILLPQRLEQLSKKHGISYKSCSVKKLKSRWGSCDNFNNIALNIYLIQLDWTLIDYVICHELTHTIHHHHQTSFWDYLSEIYPDYKNARKTIKAKPTDILQTNY